MKKIIAVIVASLAIGIGSGLVFFKLSFLNVNEGFDPVNPAATTKEIRPSK